MNDTAAVIGIDAGATHTRALAVDPDARPIASADAVGANSNSSADATAALCAVLAGLGDIHARVLVLGAAGGSPAGRGRARRVARAALDRTGVRVDRLIVVSDVETAFAAGSTAHAGTVLVAGTGAVAAHVEKFLVVHQVDGHGYLLGDRGSAYWLGRLAVRAVLDELERDATATALRSSVLERVRADPAAGSDLDDVQAIIATVYAHPPAWLGTFAPIVAQAAAAGDAVAVRMLAAARAALVRTADLARRHAEPDAPIVLTGALLASGGPLADAVSADLAERFGVVPTAVADGRRGAAALALRALPDLDPAVADRLVTRSEAGS